MFPAQDMGSARLTHHPACCRIFDRVAEQIELSRN
jgi:hypothetical protein